MKMHYHIGTNVQTLPPAALEPLPQRTLPTERRVGKHSKLLSRSAIAGAVLVAVAGCATLDADVAKAWKIEPVMNVKHAFGSSQAYYTMGRYHDGAQQWDKSVDAYRKAIATDAQNIEAYNALGVALAQIGRYSAAETTLRQAVALAPALTHVRSNLGYVLLLAGKPGDAAQELQAAVDQDNGNATAKANLRDALAQLSPATRNTTAASPATANRSEATAFAGAAPGLVVTEKVSVDLEGVTISVNLPTTITVAAPITSAEVPAPVAASVSVPLPLKISAAPAPRAIGAASTPLPAAAAAVPPTMQVVDRPTITSLEERAATSNELIPAKSPIVEAPAVALPGRSANGPALRVEVSNGNGVTGMAAHTARWLATQGVQTGRLSNQRRYVQQHTVIQYRSGQKEAALRVARSLPAHVKVALAPTKGLRNAVRVVLGRDWVQTAACLERNTCQPVATSVALAAHR